MKENKKKFALLFFILNFFFKWMLFYRNATVHGEIQWHNRRDAVEPSRSVRGARLRKRRGGVGGGGWGGWVELPPLLSTLLPEAYSSPRGVRACTDWAASPSSSRFCLQMALTLGLARAKTKNKNKTKPSQNSTTRCPSVPSGAQVGARWHRGGEQTRTFASGSTLTSLC